MILKKEAIESLNRNLSLLATGIEQDWELELADPNRIDEFISYYRDNPLTVEEKKALMSLIVASYDDFLNEKQSNNDSYENEIMELFKIDKELFTELLDYWAVIGENNSDDYFMVTPFIRNIKASI